MCGFSCCHGKIYQRLAIADARGATEAAAQFATAVQHGFGFGSNTSVFGARTI